MKGLKKVAVVLASLTAVCSLAGCGGSGQKYDETKSQLNVGVFNGGLGRVWMDSLAKDFEEYYKDVSFEEGRTGVQVIVDAKKKEFEIANLSVTMESYDNALYATDFSDIALWHQNGLLADISDTVNEKVYDEDGNLAAATGKAAVSSIHDIMYDEFEGYHDYDGKTYALPHRNSVSGIIYDADLFNKNGYYFFENGSLGAKQSDIDAGRAGKGPDGVAGTADDGMPVTYSDFQRLLVKMKSENVIPFTWAQEGALDYQKNFAFESFMANYEGSESYAKNFTSDNYEELANQEGRKAGIQFFYDVVKGGYYSSKAERNNFTAAQFEFIDSVNTDNPIAMFMEGGYWESEAREAFDAAAVINPDMGYGKRDFRLLPIPNFVGVNGITDQTNTSEKEVLLGKGQSSAVFITEKNTCQKPELQKKLAKLFLQFMHSREQLSNFTRDTGACFKTFNYTATPSEVAEYTKFGQNVYRYISEGAKCVSNKSVSEAWKKNFSKCEKVLVGCSAGIYTNAVSYFLNNPSATVNDCYAAAQQSIRGLYSIV